MKGLDDLTEIKDVSIQDILVTLLDGEHDLDLKSEILNPKDLASLNALSLVIGMNKLKGSSFLIDKFIEIYLRYMYSFKRKSREETIRAIIGMFEQEQAKITVTDRLTSNLKK